MIIVPIRKKQVVLYHKDFGSITVPQIGVSIEDTLANKIIRKYGYLVRKRPDAVEAKVEAPKKESNLFKPKAKIEVSTPKSDADEE